MAKGWNITSTQFREHFKMQQQISVLSIVIFVVDQADELSPH
jgi:hypothetical protein